MKSWEYVVDSVDTQHGETEKACLRAGAQGWQLVTSLVVETTPGKFRTRLIFKRPTRRYSA